MISIVATVLVVLASILFVWGLVDVLKSKDINLEMKAVWCLLILLLPVVGPIIYFQVKGRDKRRKFGQRFGGPNASFIR